MPEKKRPDVVFSSINVADPRFWELCLVRPSKIGQFASAAGFEGVELMVGPFDWIATAHAVARAVRRESLRLHSLHASVRSPERGGANRLLASPLGRVVMPTSVNSAYNMGRIQQLVGERPAILYPSGDPVLDSRMLAQAGPGKKLFQATDQEARRCGARTAEELVEKTIIKGAYDGLIADTAHMHPDRYNGEIPAVVSNLDASLPVLSEYIHGVHVSVGRLDCAANDKMARATTTDLQQAREGVFTGPTAQIMDAAWEAPNCDYAALEAPARYLAVVADRRGFDGLLQEYAGLAHYLTHYTPARAG